MMYAVLQFSTTKEIARVRQINKNINKQLSSIKLKGYQITNSLLIFDNRTKANFFNQDLSFSNDLPELRHHRGRYFLQPSQAQLSQYVTTYEQVGNLVQRIQEVQSSLTLVVPLNLTIPQDPYLREILPPYYPPYQKQAILMAHLTCVVLLLLFVALQLYVKPAIALLKELTLSRDEFFLHLCIHNLAISVIISFMLLFTANKTLEYQCLKLHEAEQRYITQFYVDFAKYRPNLESINHDLRTCIPSPEVRGAFLKNRFKIN